METKIITCIECPNGCQIAVKRQGNQIISIDGQMCNRGKQYAENEIVCPRRVLTTTIKTASGEVVSVKTEKPIKKENIFLVMEKINKIEAVKPIRIGDVIVANIDEDINLIATSNLI